MRITNDPNITKKKQLIYRIVELNRVLGSEISELWYEDFEIAALEDELEHLEELAEDEQ